MSRTIRPGDKAPDATVTTTGGQTLRLADLWPGGGVVLFFYPKDGTSICTRQACSFRDSYEKFVAAGVSVLGVSGDSDASHQAFAQRHSLPFHLVSDADGSLRDLFGVPKTLGVLPGRVTYVVDATGVVRLVFSAQLASDKHVRQALEALGLG